MELLGESSALGHLRRFDPRQPLPVCPSERTPPRYVGRRREPTSVAMQQLWVRRRLDSKFQDRMSGKRENASLPEVESLS
jgi:hypothetical protein